MPKLRKQVFRQNKPFLHKEKLSNLWSFKFILVLKYQEFRLFAMKNKNNHKFSNLLGIKLISTFSKMGNGPTRVNCIFTNNEILELLHCVTYFGNEHSKSRKTILNMMFFLIQPNSTKSGSEFKINLRCSFFRNMRWHDFDFYLINFTQEKLFSTF